MAVRKLKVQNFKRFRSLELDFDVGMNIPVGENDAGNPQFWRLSTLLSRACLVAATCGTSFRSICSTTRSSTRILRV